MHPIPEGAFPLLGPRCNVLLNVLEDVAVALSQELCPFIEEGLDENGIDTSSLPYSIRILLEGALRGNDGFLIRDEDIRMCPLLCMCLSSNGCMGDVPKGAIFSFLALVLFPSCARFAVLTT